MEQNFTDYVNNERVRLEAERIRVQELLDELGSKRAGIDRELSAIAAYEDTKTGKSTTHTSRGKPRGQHAGKQGTRRQQHGSKRETMMELIRQSGRIGMKRGEILKKMGLKGDKSGEMAVSNALTAMLKRHQIAREDGKYIAP